MGELLDKLQRDAVINNKRKSNEEPNIIISSEDRAKKLQETEAKTTQQTRQTTAVPKPLPPKAKTEIILPICTILFLLIALFTFLKQKRRYKQESEENNTENSTPNEEKFMKKLMLTFLLVIDIGAFLYLVINSQFIVGRDALTGMMSDGFGRTLYPAPPLLQMAYIYDWPGLTWFAVDWICGFVLLYVAYLLFHGITYKKEK